MIRENFKQDVLHAISIFFALGLLSSCNPPEVRPSNPVEITPTSQVISAATQDPMPASFLRWGQTLSNSGYSIVHESDSVNLLDSTGNIVISSSDSNTLNIVADSREAISFPQDSFEILETIGAGVPNMLTMRSEEGDVVYFYLERIGKWATPIQIQTDASHIEHYTRINLEDIWSGRALYSELLIAQPFPEGTLQLDGFYYYLERIVVGGGYSVSLFGSLNGICDCANIDLREEITEENDYRRWISFYRSVTPEGKDALIATEQELMPDGQTSLFLHYIFGPEWPWTEDYQPGNQSPRNLLDSVFLSKIVPNDEEQRVSLEVRPIIFIEYGTFTGDLLGQFVGEDARPNAAEELYRNLIQNQPVTIDPGLLEKIRLHEPEIEKRGFLFWADAEVQNLQYLALNSVGRVFYPGYYFTNH